MLTDLDCIVVLSCLTKIIMGKEKIIQFLMETNLVSHNKAHEISSNFSERTLLKNEFFLREGSFSNEYLFLESGFMLAFALDARGNEVTTNFYSNNAMVFEVDSFFNRTKSVENIHALTPCKCMCITYEKLNLLFHSMPEFRDFGRYILVKGFAALKNRTLSMITETAEHRYQRLLASNPHIFQSSPLKYIASYLGVTETSLSRIRKEFAKK